MQRASGSVLDLTDTQWVAGFEVEVQPRLHRQYRRHRRPHPARGNRDERAAQRRLLAIAKLLRIRA
ncbi:hypothetical protein [Sphingobium sp.]|uniref:hypothetical protein n=1 Tax=Sphingobium sp. TaxID=1912891 RepID=UPI002BB45225|nr:hypothetical protein [Sphingobium sp.]HUD92682.1 hypothetical protein [Sphingobium sp.]